MQCNYNAPPPSSTVQPLLDLHLVIFTLFSFFCITVASRLAVLNIPLVSPTIWVRQLKDKSKRVAIVEIKIRSEVPVRYQQYWSMHLRHIKNALLPQSPQFPQSIPIFARGSKIVIEIHFQSDNTDSIFAFHREIQKWGFSFLSFIHLDTSWHASFRLHCRRGMTPFGWALISHSLAPALASQWDDPTCVLYDGAATVCGAAAHGVSQDTPF